MFEMLFIILTVLLVYIYIGYPAVLFVLSNLFPKRHQYDDNNEPSVTLVISAHNEERVIAAKLANACELEYPPNKLSILVVSDGSSDRTDEIVLGFESKGVKLIRPPERRGKTAGLNLAFEGITSEVVLFSDANALYEPAAIRRLVRHFADQKVGYVVGHACYVDTETTAAGSSESAYWDVETKIKEWESAFSSVVGGDGAIYAIRRELYEPLQETDINDFVNPLQIVTKGYRGIFDAEARCSEKTAGKFEKEFSRKVRIANRSFNGLLRVPAACNPGKVGWFAWQLVSHKVLRWTSPFVLCLHFCVSLLAGSGQAIGLVAVAFVVMYGTIAAVALAGWLHDRKKESVGLLFMPYYFVIMNMAMATGILLRVKGRVISVWETVRGETHNNNFAAAWLPLMLLSIMLASLVMVFNLYDFDKTIFTGSAYALIIFMFVLLHKPLLRGRAV